MLPTPRAPYENVLLGAFVFGLGRQYEATEATMNSVSSRPRRVGAAREPAIAVLQQTPLDASIGDLVSLIRGRCFLMEFKRQRSDIRSELAKAHKAVIVNALNATDQVRRDQSMRLHFIAFGDRKAPGHLQIVPYADTKLALAGEEQEALTVSEFGRHLFAREERIGGTEEEFHDYLLFLEGLTGSGGAGNGLGSFLVSVSRDGTICAFPYERYETLSQLLGFESPPDAHEHPGFPTPQL